MANFPWVTVDATPILGEARPRDVKSLLRKGGIWVELYRGWLGQNAPDDVKALDFLLAGGTADKAYTKSWIDHLDSYFDSFVEEVGMLKAQLHSETDAEHVGSALTEAFPFFGEGTEQNGDEADA